MYLNLLLNIFCYRKSLQQINAKIFKKEKKNKEKLKTGNKFYCEYMTPTNL